MHPLNFTATSGKRWSARLLTGAALLLGLFSALSAPAARGCCTLSEPQPSVQKTFKVSDAPELLVSNISGPIHVIGDSKGEIRLTAAETVRGNTAGDIARAKREVRLDVSQDGNRIFVCVNGPFGRGSRSSNEACGSSGFHFQDDQYSVLFDFEVHVPAAARVTLNTINEGDIRIERVSGSFGLHNVNGGIELDAVSGAGEARTVNGEIKATFTANPGGDCSFSTVNGSVHVYLRPGLSAVLRYKTLNGDVYTDFPMTPVGETRNGMTRLSRGRFGAGQVGSGGPQIELDTLNGDIFLHRAS